MEINYHITLLTLCHFFNKNRGVSIVGKKKWYYGDFSKNLVKYISFPPISPKFRGI